MSWQCTYFQSPGDLHFDECLKIECEESKWPVCCWTSLLSHKPPWEFCSLRGPGSVKLVERFKNEKERGQGFKTCRKWKRKVKGKRTKNYWPMGYQSGPCLQVEKEKSPGDEKVKIIALIVHWRWRIRIIGLVLLVGGGLVLLGGGGVVGGVELLSVIRPPWKLYITSASFLGKSRDAGFESRL